VIARFNALAGSTPAHFSRMLSSLGGALAGGATDQTSVHGNSIGMCTNSNGQIQLGSTGGVIVTAKILLIGD
jgi:hypothetical protein